MKISWTKEPALLERAKHMWLIEGKSASIIGKELGVSRNAIIGCAYRQGWTREAAQPVVKGAYVRTQPAEAVHPWRPAPRQSQPKTQPMPKAQPQLRILGAPKTIFAIGRNECRWALSPHTEVVTADTLFCADPTEDGCSWCERHRKLLYAPVQPKPVKRPYEPGIRTIQPRVRAA